MNSDKKTVHIVGGGLAGSECAFQLAEMGHLIVLHEMRPKEMTPAHKTGGLAELVCSNSFGSLTDYSAPGQLKWEAEQLGSLILRSAKSVAVPAGMALGVDREKFSEVVSETLKTHPNIEVRDSVVTSLDDLPRPCIIATGPLTHPQLAESIIEHLKDDEDKEDFLYFFDAIAPIVSTESIDMSIAWKGDRWGKGNNDYINCPLTKDEYYNLITEIKNARKMEPKEFEKTNYFDGCMPIEEMISRGDETLRFGPLSPKGLTNPKTEKKAYAVVQLRQDNLAGTAFNMVGFQTKMAYPEQKRILSMIPGLQNAEFLKLGSIHRNMYINSPQKLSHRLCSKKDSGLFFAGQITGVEGYFESTCMGLLVAKFVHSFLTDTEVLFPPRETAFGALLNALTEPKENFQPTNINFGLLPPIPVEDRKRLKKRELRRDFQLERAKQAFHSPWPPTFP